VNVVPRLAPTVTGYICGPEPSACHVKTMTSAASAQGTPAQRWLARLSFVLAGLAIVILVVFAELKSLAMFAVGLAAVVVSVAAAYFFLSRRGIVRWLSFGVFVLLRRLAAGRREPAEVTR
jgi:hypothetical protein